MTDPQPQILAVALPPQRKRRSNAERPGPRHEIPADSVPFKPTSR